MTAFYDWQSGDGAALTLRDYPYMKAQVSDQAQVARGPIESVGQTFAARIRIQSRDEAGCEWRGLTLHDVAVRDWSGYAGYVLRLHNAGAEPVEVWVSVRDGDQNTAATQRQSLAPGETHDIFETVDELKTRLNVANIQTFCICCLEAPALEDLLVSPIYLVRA